jgi:Tol biopolymer transport system component
MVMISSSDRYPTRQYLYDVSDPLHPALVCRITNTVAHIYTGTSIIYLAPQKTGTTRLVLHALGSNHESTAATFPADVRHNDPSRQIDQNSWSRDLSRIAYSINKGDGNIYVRIADASTDRPLLHYSVPVVGTVSRPGIPPPVLAISPDGAYVAVGWAVDRPVRVYRLSDRLAVAMPNPVGLYYALWGTTGHTLYLVTATGVQAWTPETGASAVPSPPWTLAANFSPDGKQVGYTSVDRRFNVHAHVFDLAAKKDRLISAAPRSNPIFVKPGWIWYSEERSCADTANQPAACIADPTAPDGAVLAMNLATGQESRVTFAEGDAPFAPEWPFMYPWDLWPAG